MISRLNIPPVVLRLGDLCPENLPTSQRPGSFNCDLGERPILNQWFWPETAECMGIKRAPKRKRLSEERWDTDHQGDRESMLSADKWVSRAHATRPVPLHLGGLPG